MTLAFSMFNNIFPLHTKPQNFNLNYPIAVCYTKCHNANKYSLEFLFMVMNSIILMVSGRHALRSLHIYFRHFANSVCDIK